MSSTTALLGTNLVDAVSFDEESTTALYTACALGQAAAVDVLAQLGADLHIPDAAGRLPMYAATNRGHNEEVARLLVEKYKVDVHHAVRATGSTMMVLAAAVEAGGRDFIF